MLDLLSFHSLYLFSSVEFFLFLVVIFIVFWLSPHKFRNTILLIASYIFYASWDYRFLLLLLFSSIMDYLLGMKISAAQTAREKKLYLCLSLFINISILCFFKYYNFFAESFARLSASLGIKLWVPLLNIVLPLGVSFYTFKEMSYTIDIYRGKLRPIHGLVDFLLFIAYFPQLIAGPIERATELIPQIQKKKIFKEIDWREGSYMFIYGLFKKVVLADALGLIVAKIFEVPSPTGAQVLIGLYAFAIQLYCDFSGYSHMARGVSRFFGITLQMNFNLPFFSVDMQDFWKRWHISLTSWIHDYIYLPIVYKIKSLSFFGKFSLSLKFYLSYFLATFVSFSIFGLWHGQSTGIFRGIYWFCISLFYFFLKKVLPQYSIKNPILKFINCGFGIFMMFNFFALGMAFFRAESLAKSFQLITALSSGVLVEGLFSFEYLPLYYAFIFIFTYELLQYIKCDQLFIHKQGFYTQLIFYNILFFLYIQINSVSNVNFLYFQF